MNRRLRSWPTIIIFCNLFGLAFGAAAIDLKRPYDPIVLQGKTLTNFLHADTSDLYVYAYKNGNWAQIPFQIDEKDGGGYFANHNAVLDTTDEICFMAADMGDSAHDNRWIDNLESMAYQRYQVCSTDTSVIPTPKAYAYIYRSNTLYRDFSPYMQYVTPASGSADTIKTASYIFAHDVHSIPNHLQIRNGANISPDIMDRWKIRFEGNLFTFNPYSENEDTALEDTLIYVKSGPIRIIREGVFNIFMDGKPVERILSMIVTFYPQTAKINLFKVDLPNWLGMTVLRQSVDYNEHMSGAKFHWKKEFDIDVDGVIDALGDRTMSVPGFNWYMLENDIGTIATVLQNNAIEHTTQVLYYLDDNSKSNGAMRNDTGDSLAYGDSGVQINVSNGYSIEISDEDLTATFFYLNSLHSSSFGDTLMGYVMHPLKITVIPRRNDVIPVELATFTAVQEKNVVVLSWTTATESNNYGFQIQRKNNGNPNWSTIGFIQGSGTSTKMNRYAYSDERIVLGVNFYRLGQIDSDGKINYSQEVMLNLQKPQQLDLAQNYPNPFNPNTELTFQIPQSSKVTLVIYNLLGQKIRTLLDKEMMAGYHSIQWDGYGDRGEQVGSGAYIYRLQVANEVRVRKMIKMQ